MSHARDGLSNYVQASLMRLAVLCLAVTTLSAILLESEVTAQTRRPSSQRATKESIDYSKFSHATKKHQSSCGTCHKVPTENWRSVRQFPDVADYPGHEACVSCHRAQFFRGPRPPICTVCHTQAAPRAETRFAFPKPDTRLQFFTEFPHDKHQDVIARNLHYERNPAAFPGGFFRPKQ